MFEEVRKKGMGDRAALVFDPSATDPEIRYYPYGLNQEDRVQRFSIANEVFTVFILDKVLQQFYEDNIITPDAALPDFNPWADGSKYIPRERTEAFLQGMLKMILSIAFSKCRVDFEVRGTEGRCDLLISSRRTTVASGWISHAAALMKGDSAVPCWWEVALHRRRIPRNGNVSSSFGSQKDVFHLPLRRSSSAIPSTLSRRLISMRAITAFFLSSGKQLFMEIIRLVAQPFMVLNTYQSAHPTHQIRSGPFFLLSGYEPCMRFSACRPFKSPLGFTVLRCIPVSPHPPTQGGLFSPLSLYPLLCGEGWSCWLDLSETRPNDGRARYRHSRL